MSHSNSNQVISQIPLKPIKEKSMVLNSDQKDNSKTKSKSQTKPASPVVEKEKNENVNKNQHISKKTNYESNQTKPDQTASKEKKEKPNKSNVEPLPSSGNKKTDHSDKNHTKPPEDKEKTLYPPPIRHTELNPEYKKKVLEKYRSYLIRDQCGRCKLLGVFVCEHNTTVRDSFKNRVLHEGTFYKSPRRSQSIEGKNSLIERDHSPEKQRLPNKINPASRSNNFEKNQSMQHQINEVKKTEANNSHHEIKKP